MTSACVRRPTCEARSAVREASPITYTPAWKYRTTWRGSIPSTVISAVGTPPSAAAVTVTSAGSGCADSSSFSSRRCSLTSLSTGKADCRRIASRVSRCSVLTEDLRSVGLVVSFAARQVRRRRRITAIGAQGAPQNRSSTAPRRAFVTTSRPSLDHRDPATTDPPRRGEDPVGAAARSAARTRRRGREMQAKQPGRALRDARAPAHPARRELDALSSNVEDTVPRANVLTGYGRPEMLRWQEVAPLHPAAGQIRLRVRAAGVGPTDLAIRRGNLKEAFALAPDAVLGFEAAGVVDARGEGVDGGLAVGDEVAAWLPGLGGYGEYALASAWTLKPPGVSFAE